MQSRTVAPAPAAKLGVRVTQAAFEEVKGYATRERAVKRGEEVACSLPFNASLRWVVIALPTGRFAPCFIINQNVPGGPGLFLGLTNVCLVN